ncbi:hypothetical protein QFZ27_002586 [Inquilinus ginsengisoli]|uniref:hypothetical protein n=1 Tax=Inquilinus ginsengisoli TaxID=363840 RepID=UPI003D2412A9
MDQAAMLSELMELAEALARGFHALALAALAAGDLDRAGEAETRFSSLFLGIRRAIALKIRLRQQREQARREAELRRTSRQDQKDDRRHAVAQAIAAVPDPEVREQLAADLQEKLTEDERIDVDLADTTLSIEALIASLCRALGLPPGGIPPAGGPAAGGPAAAAKSGTDDVGPKGQASGPAPRRASSNLRRAIPADAAGEPEGERGIHHGAATGEIFNRNREPVPTPPGDDRPDAVTGPPATAPPPDPAPPRDQSRWTDPELAGRRSRETERGARWRHSRMLAHIHRHG